MSAFLFIIKVICILADIGFSIILIYFMQGCEDRASLFGFGAMLGTLMLNVLMLVIG